jgi:hypothetical protein
MSSRRRRQLRRNYYHHRGDGFTILPVPADTDAGPVTRAQPEKQARELQAMGILPPSPPRVPVYREVPGEVIEFLSNGDFVLDVSRFSLNAPSPGLFCIHIILHCDVSVRLGLGLTDSSGDTSSIKTIGPVDTQVFLIQVINNHWSVASPLAGMQSLMFSAIGDATFSSPRVVLPDGDFSVSCYSEATDIECKLQMFAYLAVPG